MALFVLPTSSKERKCHHLLREIKTISPPPNKYNRILSFGFCIVTVLKLAAVWQEERQRMQKGCGSSKIVSSIYTEVHEGAV